MLLTHPFPKHVFQNQISTVMERHFPEECKMCFRIVIPKFCVVNTPFSGTCTPKSNKHNYERPFSEVCNMCLGMGILDLYVVNTLPFWNRYSGTK